MKKSQHYLVLNALAFAAIAIISYHADAKDNKAEAGPKEYQQIKAAKITLAEALQKAQAAHPDLVVSGADFEVEDGIPAYSVELLGKDGETEVTVNAVNGEVIQEKD